MCLFTKKLVLNRVFGKTAFFVLWIIIASFFSEFRLSFWNIPLPSPPLPLTSHLWRNSEKNDAIMIQSTKNAVFPKTRLRTSFFVNKHKEAAGFIYKKKTAIKENCVFVLRVMIASFCEMMRSFFSEYRLRRNVYSVYNLCI